MSGKNILKVDGRFYYGWVMLFCDFMTMFICYVVKANLNCTPFVRQYGILNNKWGCFIMPNYS